MLSRLRSAARGFTLIEMMVTITVMTILALLAMPGMTAWVANNRVRTVAEAMQNALRQAQGEAVKRSRQTVFALTAQTPAASATPSANGGNWYLQTLPLSGSDDGTAGSFLRGEKVATTQSVTITGASLLCFNSLGRLVSNTSTGLGASCTAPTSYTAYNLTASGADRPLRVEVYLGGKVRMCDPAKTLSSSNPDGCAT
ncbi:GspH/FimT family pseudopilin [Uliginosibacterium paludis]|uniref:Type II secretion system protein H n=1 Tax=Uliginosibacterium paludis TaxID=1615952 RepID=A0ABV2CTL1_9RHOO